MEGQREEASVEIKRLQRCISDLVSLLALPAIWSGGDSSHVLHTLLESLLGMLALDLISVRLKDPVGGAPIEIVRLAQLREPMPPTHEICEALSQGLADKSRKWPPLLRHIFGDGDVSIVPLPLGLQGEIGVIVAASERADFPRQTEALVLSVAANQASIGLQEARLWSQQRRIAAELDRQVAQRTAQLAAANEELKAELAERRLVEERLRQEEREFKRSEVRKAAILDSALDCIVTMDQEGRITDFNPAAERTFGHRHDEVVGRYVADVIVPPSLREKHRQGFARYFATGQSRLLGRRVEMTAVRADGSEFQVEIAITRTPLDGPPSFTGYLRDITEHKQNEKALRDAHAQVARSEERWRSVFENSAIGVALTDLNGRFLAANPVYEAMLGYTEQELLKLSFLDITEAEYFEANRKLIGELLTGEREHFQIEKQYRRKNGSLMWVRDTVSLVPGTERLPRFLMSLSEDITERKQAREKLRRSEALLAEVQRISLTGGFSWRVDTGEVAFSEEAYRIFEFKKDAPVTLEQIAGRVHPEDVPFLSEKMTGARSGDGDQDYEIRLRMPDGSVKYLHTISHGIRNHEGRLEHIGAIQDITRRRVSEEALGKARSELAQVSRVTALGVLTASIAHEVNQPLSGITTNASTCLRMLAADPPNVDGARETARRTIRDANRASEVITRLRALYSKKDPSPEPLDLNEAAREVIALAQADLQKNRVILRSELADDLPRVIGDRVQLQQVILNLVRNGSDAMSPVEDRPRQLVIRTERDDVDRVRLTVQDAGVGFAPQAADRLFDAFYTTKGEGMGIGLSVSRSIIEHHNGRLWATLNEGPGATFSFSVPRAHEDPARADGIDNIQAPAVTDTDAA
ncbi:MAG: PAS domain S-box protein [Terriglobales bacterium]|jgi:PAS domain S-box-containing protein